MGRYFLKMPDHPEGGVWLHPDHVIITETLSLPPGEWAVATNNSDGSITTYKKSVQ